jgi:hypothetical protein
MHDGGSPEHALLGEWSRCDALFAAPPDDPQGLNDYWVNRARTLFYNPSPERLLRFEADLSKARDFETREAVLGAVAAVRGEQTAATALTAYRSPKSVSKRRAAYVAAVLTELACIRGDLDAAVASLESADVSGIDILWLDTCSVLAALRDRAEVVPIRARVAARAAAVREALGTPAT